MLRVGPDQKDGVHDGDKEVRNLTQFEGGILQLEEVLRQGLEVLVVLISLHTSDLNFLLKLGESAGLGRLVLFEELENLLDALASELVADRVEVLTLVLPEIDLSDGAGVDSLFEGHLWVLAELSFDLLGPLRNCGEKYLVSLEAKTFESILCLESKSREQGGSSSEMRLSWKELRSEEERPVVEMAA